MRGYTAAIKLRVRQQGRDEWVVEVFRGAAMVLNGERISDEKWAVVAGPFSTKEEAERERAQRENK